MALLLYPTKHLIKAFSVIEVIDTKSYEYTNIIVEENMSWFAKNNSIIQMSILVISICVLSLVISSCGSEPEVIQEIDEATIVYIEYPSYGRHFRENQLKKMTLELLLLENFSGNMTWMNCRNFLMSSWEI